MHCRLTSGLSQALKPLRDIFPPHASQRIANLPERDIILHALNKQRHQVVRATRRVLQFHEQLGRPSFVSRLAKRLQLLPLSQLNGCVHLQTFQRESFVHGELIDTYDDLLLFLDGLLGGIGGVLNFVLHESTLDGL